MTQYVGIALAALVLVAVAAGLWWTWRRPFVGLGLLVAGLALHNIRPVGRPLRDVPLLVVGRRERHSVR